MGRAPRIEYEGAIHHVTARGNAQADVFRTTQDAEAFLNLLGGEAGRRGWRCLAYCLMPNHYHLLVKTPQPNLSEGMHVLDSRYARRFNAVYDRVGHVFQGRFHAAPVTGDEHLLGTLRYIASNPVDARLADHPAAWPWSSHRATAGYATPPTWLAVDDVRRLFIPPRAESYRVFVERRHQVPGTA